MKLWSAWWMVVRELRPACSRGRTFLWLAVALAGVCVREDLFGVTSLVRVFGLTVPCYDRLLDFFHSPGLDPERLARHWTALVLKFFPALHRSQGRLVLLADGIKIPKAVIHEVGNHLHGTIEHGIAANVRSKKSCELAETLNLRVFFNQFVIIPDKGCIKSSAVKKECSCEKYQS